MIRLNRWRLRRTSRKNSPSLKNEKRIECGTKEVAVQEINKDISVEEELWSLSSYSDNFSILSREVMFMIFQFFSIKELGRVMWVCKSWNLLCGQLIEEQSILSCNPQGKKLKLSPNPPPPLFRNEDEDITYDPIFPQKEPLREYNIVVVGGGASGKSCLVYRYVSHGYVEKYDPTIEDTYQKRCVIDGISCMINIVDTGGAEYQALTDHYIRTAEGFLLLYSVNSRNSFEYTQKIRKRILDMWKKSSTCPPIILVATKHDIPKKHHVVTIEEGQALANEFEPKYYHNFFSTTSKVCEPTIQFAFQELARQIDEWKFTKPIRPENKRRRRKCRVM